MLPGTFPPQRRTSKISPYQMGPKARQAAEEILQRLRVDYLVGGRGSYLKGLVRLCRAAALHGTGCCARQPVAFFGLGG
jgi:hypothetical protein